MSERRWHGDYRGQSLVEYSVILLFVAIAVFATLALIGPGVTNLISGAANGFPGS